MKTVEDYSKQIIRDLNNRKEVALFHIMESNFLKLDEAKKRIRFERQGECEYLVFDDKRVWKIRTVYEGTKVYNESEWIV
jgi:hypothetical protein